MMKGTAELSEARRGDGRTNSLAKDGSLWYNAGAIIRCKRICKMNWKIMKKKAAKGILTESFRKPMETK